MRLHRTNFSVKAERDLTIQSNKLTKPHFFGNLVTVHFSEKFYSRCTLSCPACFNDTGLKSVALPGADSIAVQTDRHSDIFEYYNKDFCSNILFLIFNYLIGIKSCQNCYYEIEASRKNFFEIKTTNHSKNREDNKCDNNALILFYNAD